MNEMNRISIRLYRILLRSTRDAIASSGRCARTVGITNSSSEKNKYMMLQPPLDSRDYGRARILPSHHALWTPTNCNSGDLSDDSDTEDDNDNDSDDDNAVLLFLKHWKRRKQWQQGGSSSDNRTMSILLSTADFRQAIRTAFSAPIRQQQHDDELAVKKTRHRRAIHSVKLLQRQFAMWERTSVSVDWEYGVRVVAATRCIGSTVSLSSNNVVLSDGKFEPTKHRFAYRIQIEHFAPPATATPHSSSTTAVQLLGRTWNIVEHADNNDLLHQFNDSQQQPQRGDKVVTVQAPNTGAVGHLPVLRTGQVFEYMSGCELATNTGSMSGAFHMALVDDDTQCALVGDVVPAFQSDDATKFLVQVLPFSFSRSQ